ncbi:hypothetical protein BKA65DRAFT_150373 [Rhexocercosporidium sp. MPI-PUGE-AT-0058]|nr:hypothetical protein BKA65DRAFT_150373 [Rhexocercosporidium sp. MPI-PUGE-AT-0058]
MAIGDVADQYFTYEARLASFQNTQQLAKRRASNASTKAGKSIKWPHKFLSGEELAKAGFFYHPLQTNPDNVACFLCHRSLDGWEEDDDPLAEHLKHSPDCGWAIVATIEKQDGILSVEYPSNSTMIAARKATFADKWPHEGKKGWKCKVKHMVDAGWKYTPTPEYDDMATCAYCNLALDGWENSDKPMDEHFKRSPECPFFALINEHLKSPAPKKTKTKRDRTSKASRLSIQSAFTVASEAPEDLPAEEEDSILTTATNATTKRMGKAKKAPAAKGRKTKAKKGEPVEVVEVPEPEDADFDVKVDVEVAPKPSRGRKRKSEEELETAPAVDVAPPAAKRRATRTRGSTAVDDSIISHDEPPQDKPKPAGRKGRASRKVSSASIASRRAPVIDDEEIDKALEADLERPLTEDEGEPAAILPPKGGTRASKITKADHHMFDAAPIEIDEATIDAELEAMEVDSKPLPKAKGAKGKQPRKVSAKQRAADKKAADAAAEAERLAEEEASQQIAEELEHSISMQHSSPVIHQKKQRASARQPANKAPGRATRGSVMSVSEHNAAVVDIPEQNDESGNETDASMASQSTVVRGGASRRGSTMKKGKGSKKGPSRNIEEIVHKAAEPVVVEEEAPLRLAKGKRILHAEEIMVSEETYHSRAPGIAEAVMDGEKEKPAAQPSKSKAAKARGRPRKISTPAPPSREAVPENGVIEKEASVLPGPTPVKVSSPIRSLTPPPKEMTPSQSPQSSDAENHPPSSKPSAAAHKVVTPMSSRPRIPLSESTPIISPSKRNVIAGLQSNQPWTSVDLDTIFMKSPRAAGPAGDLFGGAAEKVKNGDLTSPEKRMTVEEWIQHNAAMAEEKLRSECERMVSVFESQGSRAMQALEGVECLE